MGPASVRAIKEGEVNMPHDVKFALSEVNGDYREIQQNKEGKWEIVYQDRKKVGKIM